MNAPISPSTSEEIFRTLSKVGAFGRPYRGKVFIAPERDPIQKEGIERIKGEPRLWGVRHQGSLDAMIGGKVSPIESTGGLKTPEVGGGAVLFNSPKNNNGRGNIPQKERGRQANLCPGDSSNLKSLGNPGGNQRPRKLAAKNTRKENGRKWGALSRCSIFKKGPHRRPSESEREPLRRATSILKSRGVDEEYGDIQGEFSLLMMGKDGTKPNRHRKPGESQNPHC